MAAAPKAPPPILMPTDVEPSLPCGDTLPYMPSTSKLTWLHSLILSELRPALCSLHPRDSC
jgi:hypothetical protein